MPGPFGQLGGLVDDLDVLGAILGNFSSWSTRRRRCGRPAATGQSVALVDDPAGLLEGEAVVNAGGNDPVGVLRAVGGIGDLGERLDHLG